MKSVGIIGAGPAGCAAAYFLKDKCSITIIDPSLPLKTILPTGGGRCNLGYAEYDFRELVRYYPRGNKFLLSVFSRFATGDTLDFFDKLGIETYTQEDNRIFPVTNSSKNVRDALLKGIENIQIKREKALRIEPGEKFKVVTDMGAYWFDNIIVAFGGHAGYEMIERLGIEIIPPVPALVGLVTKEDTASLAGVGVSAIWVNGSGCQSLNVGCGEDKLLFTHKGISGPLVYKISSIKAREKFPYTLSFNLYPQGLDLQTVLNKNPHKQINNLLSEFLPKRIADYIVDLSGISPLLKCHAINGKQRDSILKNIHNFSLTICGTVKDGEVVTAGGVDLNEVNPKTMESKKIKGLYFTGEVLDIDGFCGGFNLQNCWSTAFVAASAITN